ncbi:MAG: DUF1178 family protein [Pseudomonadota bacterium]
MIIFDLKCTNEHLFEGWFQNLKDFEHQHSEGILVCPTCNSKNIMRDHSKISVKIGSTSASAAIDPNAPCNDKAATPQTVIDFLDKNFENVGSSFATEALKMHYGATESRNIRGTSSPTEEETLKKEGIKFMKVPIPRFDA